MLQTKVGNYMACIILNEQLLQMNKVNVGKSVAVEIVKIN